MCCYKVQEEEEEEEEEEELEEEEQEEEEEEEKEKEEEEEEEKEEEGIVNLTKSNRLSFFHFFFQKTRHPEAEEWFSKALSVAPRDPSVRTHLGLFLMDAGRNLEAARSFEEAVRLGGDGDEAYESAFNAGVAYRMAGVMDRAEFFYRKAADMRPKVRRRGNTQPTSGCSVVQPNQSSGTSRGRRSGRHR